MGVLLSFSLALGPNSEKELSFDIENFRKIRNEAQANTEEIIQQKDRVQASIEQLKEKWKTPAGEYFFKNFDNDWIVAVENYKKTMQVFIDVMDDVIDILSKVETEASTITV